MSSRLRILDHVKRNGPLTAEAAATALGVTPMAVRQHLYVLEEEGLVAHAVQARGRGRPSKLWRVTPKADAHFADAHAALAADLMGQMRKTFGEAGLDRLLRQRTADQQKAYGERIAGKHTLKARLDALARIRSAEGYMAEVRRGAEPGTWLFVENHCPVCAAAKLCTGLCREELALFTRVLGHDVQVERTDHIVAGAGRCAYRVRPV